MKSVVFRLFLLLLLPFSALVEAAAPYLVQPAPDWVLPQSYESQPMAETQTVAFLLRDTQLRLQPQLIRYHRNVTTPVSAAAISEASALSVDYNPAYETVQLHGIRLSRDGNVRDLTHDVQSRVLQREQGLENGVHDGMVSVVFILEDVRVGDIIDFSYSVSGSNPIFSGHRAGFASVDSGVPTSRRHLRILTAKARPLQVRVFNDTTPVASRTLGELQEYRWQAEQLPAVQIDQGTPDWHMPFRWLSYSEYASWSDVVAWAQPLYQRAARPDPAIQAQAKRLRAASQNDQEFITQALDFVQNDIRYLGLSLGANTHKPYPAAEVLRRRFGDCKDKTMLLIELLASGGIKAHPALVATARGKGIASELPSHGVFDHVIVLLELGERRYWLDGTRLYQAGILSERSVSDFGLALPIRPGQDALVSMYDTNEPRYIVDTVEEIEASSFDGPVTLKVETRYRRNAADFQRYRFATQPPQQVARSYLDYYRQHYTDVKAEGVPEFHDDTRLNEIVVRERYTIGQYWQKGENGLSAPVRLSVFSDAIPAPEQLTRQSPYAIPAGRRINSTFNLRFPMAMGIKTSAETLRIEHPAFLYQGQEAYRGQVYTYRSRLETRADAVDAGDMQEFSTKLRQMERDWVFGVNIPSAEKMGWPSIVKLKESLKKAVRP